MIAPRHRPVTLANRDWAPAFNELVDFANSLRLMAGQNTHIARTSGGQRIDVAIERAIPQDLEIFPYAIDSIQNDFVSATKIESGERTGESIDVAKPWELRLSTWSGKTIDGLSYSAIDGQDRTVTVGTAPDIRTITERVTPHYNIDDVIWVVSVPAVYTVDPSDAEVFLPLSGTAGAIDHIDINVDSRRWKPPYVVVEVCVNDLIKHMVVVGGAAS